MNDGSRGKRWHDRNVIVCASLVAVALAACSSSSSGSSGSASASSGPPSLASLKGSTLVITTWGGVWTQDEQKYLYGPFTKDTGINVRLVTNGSDPSIPAILQEQQNNVSIDIAEPLNPVVMLNKGYAQTFPHWLQAEFAKYLRPGAYTTRSIDIGDTASVIACNPAVMKKCPLTPAEFFDPKAYPGPRAIVDDPTEALPMALEALGVPGNKLFPLNIPRAMAELKMIKPYISVWPSSGSQQQQVLIDKQVGAAIMWNGRAYVVRQQSIPALKISWSGALLPEPNGFVVLKNAPNAAAAFEYFSWLAQHPKNQAEWTNAITYPTPAKNLDSYLPQAIKSALPVGQKVTITSNYWFAANLNTLEQTWQSFLG
jgi:putative spermidine/putrescine transport system substrate-binding protein